MRNLVSSPHLVLSILIDIYCSQLVPEELSFALLDLCFELANRPSTDDISFACVQERLTDIDRDCKESVTIAELVRKLDDIEDAAGLLLYMKELRSELLVEDPSISAQDMVPLHPSSFLGVFIRTVSLNCMKASFEEMHKIYDDFVLYIGQSNSRVDDEAKDFQTRKQTDSTAMETSMAIEHQIERLTAFHGQGVHLSEIENVLRNQAENINTESFYLKFLQSWQRGDYASSIENLSRHFDYKVGDSEKSTYQYALLNLALLQADFGCRKEALWAIYETIDAARDSQDDACLNFALSWLTSFAASNSHDMQDDSPLQESDSQRYVIQKAHENNLPVIESIAYLAKKAYSGKQVYENLLKSQTVTLRAGRSLTLTQYMTAAKMWSTFDQPILSKLYLELAMKNSNARDNSEEAIRLQCHYATQLFDIGMKQEAFALLENLPEENFSTAAYHRIWSTTRAILRLRDETLPAHEEDLLLERIDATTNMDTASHIIRRSIRKGELESAWTLIRDYFSKGAFHVQYHQAHEISTVQRLLLSAEVFAESSEPERAIALLIQAMQLAYKNTLFLQYRSARSALESMVAKLRKN